MADGIELFNIASVPVTPYRYRGSKIPNPWTLPGVQASHPHHGLNVPSLTGHRRSASDGR
jgi:hypothetical protein